MIALTHIRALASAASAFLESVERIEKERALAPIQDRLRKDMQKSFWQQEKVFAQQFELYKGQFAESIYPDQVKRIFGKVENETETGMIDSLIRGTRGALAAGANGMVKRLALGIDISFDLANPRAVNWLSQNAALKVTHINETTRETIGRLVTQGVNEGWSYNKVAKEISSRFEEFRIGKPQLHIESRAHLVAITECFPGNVLVGAFPFSVSSLAFSGKFPMGVSLLVEALGDLSGGGRFPQGLKPTILGATRRWYQGDLIKITTTSGYNLSGTPNHPISTDRGWVTLGNLIEGDHIICCSGREEVGLGYPNINNMPTPISEVFHALQATTGVATKRVHGSDMDFHGDGRESEVEIVTINSQLGYKYQTTLEEPVGHELLSKTDLREVILARAHASQDGSFGFLAPLAHAGKLTHSTSRGHMCVCQDNPTFSGIPFTPHDLAGFGHPTDWHTSFFQQSPDAIGGDTKPSSNTFAGFSCNVRFDSIISINRFHFTGHVYNLLTSIGHYTANGIIAHNCGNAYEQGNIMVAQDLKARGLTIVKYWSNVGDDRVSDGCIENTAAGWIGVDEPFPSGDDRPPRFPGCRCAALYKREGAE